MSLLEMPAVRDNPRATQHRVSQAFTRFISSAACALVLLGCGTTVDGAAPPDRIRVQFGEVDTLFVNPGQGWMSQQRTPPEHPRFPYSVVYVRFNWADAEPEEGRYNWALIDDVIESAWKQAPVVFEWFGNYDYLRQRDWSFKDAVHFMLRNRVTLINDNIGRVPPEAMPALEELARRAGSRLLLRELAHPATGRPGDSLPFEMQWANVGVGKLYQAWVLRVELIDVNHQVAVSTDAQVDPRDWLPGEHAVQHALPLPASLTAGAYQVAVSIVDPSGQRRPFRLAMNAPDLDGRYRVSQVHVR